MTCPSKWSQDYNKLAYRPSLKPLTSPVWAPKSIPEEAIAELYQGQRYEDTKCPSAYM